MKKHFSPYILFGIGLALIIEPTLPQYHFSLFWFSLGAISVLAAIRDIILTHKI